MADNNPANIDNPETEKEETPEWAKNLTETIADLPNRLKEILAPQETPQQDPPPVNQPVEIVLPQPPEQETPQPQEVETEQPPQEKPQKKRRFLDWLL